MKHFSHLQTGSKQFLEVDLIENQGDNLSPLTFMSLHSGISNLINEKTATFNEIEGNNLNSQQGKESETKNK